MLGINFQQILLHLLNFVILFAVAYFLLYKPVKKFMAEREQYYKDIDEEAKRNLAQAEEKKSEYEAKLSGVSDELREIRARVQEEASKSAEAVLENAQKEAKNIIGDARTKAEYECRRSKEEANEEITRLANEATEKLLEQKTAQVFDDFLDTVERNGKHEEE